MDYGNLKVPENVTPEVQTILDSYANRNKEIEKAHRKNMGRIGAGALLELASLHPILNIPYVGTGLGGALFESGNAIMEGKKAKDIAKDAGIGFAVGESVGAIPYVGKYASKTKAGQAVANKVAPTVESLLNTPIAKKVEDALMTDIKAFNPFKQTQTVYHGSPYDFAKFSNEAIGTGEGAQAHGMGHYAAKSKDVAQGYADRLSNQIEDEIKTITYDGIPYEYKYGSEILSDPKKPFLADVYANRDDYKTVVNNYLDMYDKNLQQYNDPNYLEFLKAIGDKSDTNRVIENLNNMKNFVKNFDINKLERNTNKQLYKLSIPKDDVMLREDLPFSQQPKAVQDALEQYMRDEYKGQKPFVLNDVLKIYEDLLGVKTGKDFYKQISKGELSKYNKNPEAYPYKLKNIYQNEKEGLELGTNKLNNLGIKGISYNGGIDGEARVIFNPEDIEIVKKYYNQPSLGEMLLKKSPNAGATSNYLYDLMIRE